MVCVSRILSVWTVYGLCGLYMVCVDCIWSVWTWQWQIHACLNMHINTHVHTHTHTLTCAHPCCKGARVLLQAHCCRCRSPHTRTHMCQNTHAHMHTHTRLCTHAYAHMYIHIRTHTCARTPSAGGRELSRRRAASAGAWWVGPPRRTGLFHEQGAQRR